MEPNLRFVAHAGGAGGKSWEPVCDIRRSAAVGCCVCVRRLAGGALALAVAVHILLVGMPASAQDRIVTYQFHIAPLQGRTWSPWLPPEGVPLAPIALTGLFRGIDLDGNGVLELLELREFRVDGWSTLNWTWPPLPNPTPGVDPIVGHFVYSEASGLEGSILGYRTALTIGSSLSYFSPNAQIRYTWGRDTLTSVVPAAVVPEPATETLLALGLAAVAARVFVGRTRSGPRRH